MHHKQQHLVPVSYLKAWCDPLTPLGHEPYVWITTKSGKEIRKKAPKNVLSEHDFYTIYDESGNRILDLELYLKKVEDDFLYVRNIIGERKPIKDDDFISLILFIIIAYARTKFQKSEQSKLWQELLSIYNVLNIQERRPEVYVQVKRLHSQPTPFFISNLTNIALPILIKMNLTILETSKEKGFLTSDNPIIWIDPSIAVPNYPLTFYGLGSPLLEILFPISPSQLVKLAWLDPEGYLSTDSQPQLVDEINRFIVSNSEDFVVMNHNQPNPYWFGN